MATQLKNLADATIIFDSQTPAPQNNTDTALPSIIPAAIDSADTTDNSTMNTGQTDTVATAAADNAATSTAPVIGSDSTADEVVAGNDSPVDATGGSPSDINATVIDSGADTIMMSHGAVFEMVNFYSSVIVTDMPDTTSTDGGAITDLTDLGSVDGTDGGAITDLTDLGSVDSTDGGAITDLTDLGSVDGTDGGAITDLTDLGSVDSTDGGTVTDQNDTVSADGTDGGAITDQTDTASVDGTDGGAITDQTDTASVDGTDGGAMTDPAIVDITDGGTATYGIISWVIFDEPIEISSLVDVSSDGDSAVAADAGTDTTDSSAATDDTIISLDDGNIDLSAYTPDYSSTWGTYACIFTIAQVDMFISFDANGTALQDSTSLSADASLPLVGNDASLSYIGVADASSVIPLIA
ncbi:hypothetical protein [Methylovulum psychrotolerans]|uniref:Uncharacterized protein n=1 Tax=Methylovulum psychrotolerans TaxID=1704499 RepID=A0A2S5CSG5_9GAMM|nr:hypothetical protein [Methylovulum psychrotolerans]POZ53745.1 hypothetical protein AADEFJLK_00786 [Methylovulum psychrotolerans]